MHDGRLSRTQAILPAQRLHSDPLKPTAVITYAPTAKGEKAFRPIEQHVVAGRLAFPGVCAARAEITEVVRWTDPADMFGRTISQVTYRYRGVDIDPSVRPEMRTRLGRSKEATEALVRTSDGWRRADER